MNTETQDLSAPFSLRIGALLIDYTLCAAVLAGMTILSRAAASGTRGAGDNLVESFGYLVVIGLFVFNFILLAGTSGRTIGKWATGLCITTTDGYRAGFPRLFVRHVIGYPLTALTLGAGFLLSIFTRRGRSLHDLIAGTVVVRDNGTVRTRRPAQPKRAAVKSATAKANIRRPFKTAAAAASTAESFTAMAPGARREDARE